MGFFYDSKYGGQCIGRVEPNGEVYDSQYGGHCIGRVEPNGEVFDSKYGVHCIGRGEPDGKIYNSKYGCDCIGRVEPNGEVYDSKYGGRCIGRVEGMCSLREGVAMRLLCISKGSTAVEYVNSTITNPTTNTSYNSTNTPIWPAYVIIAVLIFVCNFLGYSLFMWIGIVAIIISIIAAIKYRKELTLPRSLWKIIKGLLLGLLVCIISVAVCIVILTLLNPSSLDANQAREDATPYIEAMSLMLAGTTSFFAIFTPDDD